MVERLESPKAFSKVQASLSVQHVLNQTVQHHKQKHRVEKFSRAYSGLKFYKFYNTIVTPAQMVEAMKAVAKMDVELTVEERNLLSVAYKNVIGARRASSRIISSIEQKEENKGNEQHVSKIKEYRGKVESELSSICNDILTIRECSQFLHRNIVKPLCLLVVSEHLFLRFHS